ncbi:MAG: serine/threonine-protein kinase [Kofleriaceae bacterium]
MSALQLEPGTRVGRYRVIAPLGRGGMGGVFEVEGDDGTRYALKAPITDTGASQGAVTKRFAREANALRMLDHPNLVAAVDAFAEAGLLFLVMEKVVGTSLSERLRAGALAPRQALVFARQMLEGIGHAHAAGLVHRDLKPENAILVDMGGWERVKIIDFGLVKLIGDVASAFGQGALTSTGLVFGTPAYMAPEQALGRPVDTRADLYAMGVILFHMLAGSLPFDAVDPAAIMRMHVKQPAPRLDERIAAPWLTPELVALVDGALIKEPENRFPRADVMIAALDDAFASLDRVL